MADTIAAIMTESVTMTEELVSLPDGYAVHTRLFRPAGAIKSVLVYLHGIQSHGGWYEGSGSHLAQQGRLVIMPDRRGSGKNQTGRGDAASAWQLIADLQAVIARARGLSREWAGRDLPLDLLGVSWGGKLAMCFQEYVGPAWEQMLILSDGPERHVEGVKQKLSDVRSLTLVAPGFCPLVNVPWSIKLAVAGCMLIGQKQRTFELPLCDPTLFTDLPERQAYIRDDPLALRRGTARLLFVSHQLDRLAREVRDRWAGVAKEAAPSANGQNLSAPSSRQGTRPSSGENMSAQSGRHGTRSTRSTGSVQGSYPLPIHLVLAGEDRIIDNERTRRWFAPLAQHLTVSEFPGGGHTLEFEPDPTDYYQCLSGWLGARDGE